MKRRDERDFASGAVRSGGGYKPRPEGFGARIGGLFNSLGGGLLGSHKGKILVGALLASTAAGGYAVRAAQYREALTPEDVKADLAMLMAGEKPLMDCFAHSRQLLYTIMPTDDDIAQGKACVPKPGERSCSIAPNQLKAHTEHFRVSAAELSVKTLKEILASSEARRILQEILQSPEAASVTKIDPKQLRELSQGLSSAAAAVETLQGAEGQGAMQRLAEQGDMAALAGKLQANPETRHALNLLQGYFALLVPEAASYCFRAPKNIPAAQPVEPIDFRNRPAVTN